MLDKILYNLKNYPDNECYQIKEKIYKNRDLYQYVCNIYEYLLEKNPTREKIVVYGHKQIYMIASFLACSFAGITYVPIDESVPVGRKNSIIEQVKPKFIIDNNIENIMQKKEFKDISKVYMRDNDIYYIIFTSGSTGEPKGVQITYENLKSCMNWLEDITNINKNDIILNQANFSFDLSVADIYLALITGSKHYILERDVQRNYIQLFEELKNSNSSFAVMTPSFADLLLIDKAFNDKLMPNLKQILFCGEMLNKKTVSNLYSRFKDIKIINCYGPTECTFAVTSGIILNDEDISIGFPKKDVEIFILDENGKEVEENEIGEIIIAGASVGKGYLKSDLNKNVFINYKNMKAYCTGDLGFKKNNQIFYVGRKDKQVKYKGYRIELLEIEKIINKLDYVEKAIVTTKSDNNVVKKIIAFVKLKDKKSVEVSEIKKYLDTLLPDYMIPLIKIIEDIPLNENGKIDEKKLIYDYQLQK